MSSLVDAIAWGRCEATAVETPSKTLSYLDLRSAVDRAAVQLSRAVPGQRVALVGLDPTELVAFFYACDQLELAPLPVVSDDDAYVESVFAVAEPHHVVTQAGCHTSASSAAPLSPSDACLLLLTSGTTSGRRKVVQLGDHGFGSTASFMNERMEVDDTISEAVLAPLDHAFALGRIHAVLCAGGRLLLPGETNMVSWLFESLSERGANAISAVPSVLSTVLSRMSEQLESEAAGVQWVQTGAMRFGIEMRKQLLEVAPNAEVFLHYGLTEAMRTTFFALRANPSKLHTEGPAADGVDVAILDPSTDEPVESGLGGRIAIMGRNLCLGYYGISAWQEDLSDGWFLTGDRGHLDGDGFLVFEGRIDDVINSNGHILHPEEVESLLEKLFPQQEIAVAGRLDPTGVRDTEVVLYVENDTEVTMKDVRQHMHDAAGFMVPRTMVVVPEFPRTRTGKVIRRRLQTLSEGHTS